MAVLNWLKTCVVLWGLLLVGVLGGVRSPVAGQGLSGGDKDPTAWEEGLEPNRLLTPEAWAKMPQSFREQWAQPNPRYLQEHLAQPKADQLRREFFQTLLAFVKASWLPLDLEQRLAYLQIGDGLEGLARSYFYLHYEQEGHAYQIKGHWHRLALLIRPPQLTIPDVVRRELEEARAQHGAEVQPYAEAPRDVGVFLVKLWERYLKVAPPPLDRQVASAVLPIIERRAGGLRFVTVLDEEPLREYTVYLWTDGQVVEIRADKPDPWNYSNPVVIPFTPDPAMSEVQPLNPQEVLYEESRLFWDEGGNPVNEGQKARKTLLRIIYRRPSRNFRNMEYWVMLPVTPLKWHLCEYHALMRRCIAQVEGLLYSSHYEEGLNQPQFRKTIMVSLEGTEQTYREWAEKFSAFQAPSVAEQVHATFQAALRRGTAAWALARLYWQQFFEQHPRIEQDVFFQACRTLSQRLEQEGYTEIRGALYESLQHLVELLGQQSIGEVG